MGVDESPESGRMWMARSYVSNVHILELPNLVLNQLLSQSLLPHAPRREVKKKDFIL
jgi:hypothetical protein